MAFRKSIPALFLLVSLLLCVLSGSCAEGEEECPLLGEWAFDYEPETAVFRLEEDGTAWYKNQTWVWKDQTGFLLLTDSEGSELRLRYLAEEQKTVIYQQTSYHRGKAVEGQGGLIGIWEGVSDGSTFVFTPAGYFLEDSAFSGQFLNNSEEGTFLLHYGEVFEDTLCYYSISDDEILTVEYPWPIVRTKN